jgi:hypothetical protein
MKPTLAFDSVGDCFVLVIGKKDPADSDWKDYLAFLRQNLTQKPGMKPVTLVFSEGGGPAAAQRAAVNELTKEFRVVDTVKVAVLTESNLVVGMATAMAWFVKGYRAWAPKDIAAALVWLGVSDADGARIKVKLPGMRDKVG